VENRYNTIKACSRYIVLYSSILIWCTFVRENLVNNIINQSEKTVWLDSDKKYKKIKRPRIKYLYAHIFATGNQWSYDKGVIGLYKI